MTVAGIAALVGIVTAILGPALIFGRILGRVLTTQAVHEEALGKHAKGIAQKGERIEALGRELSELRGELRGRGAIG